MDEMNIQISIVNEVVKVQLFYHSEKNVYHQEFYMSFMDPSHILMHTNDGTMLYCIEQQALCPKKAGLTSGTKLHTKKLRFGERYP